MRVIHLARRPLSENSVSANVLTHGTGALHINATRVAHAGPADFARHESTVQAIKQRGGSMDNSWKNSSDLSGASDVSSAGRWPANLILQHKSGCRQTGTVEGSGYQINRRVDGAKPFGGGAGHKFTSEHQGGETVADWVCEPDCPVADLDEQSGVLVSGRLKGDAYSQGGRANDSMFAGDGVFAHKGYAADKDGASRFFKQVQAMSNDTIPTELIDYLRDLVLPPGGDMVISMDLGDVDWGKYGDEQLHALIGCIPLNRDPAAFLGDVWRVLKPGAHICLFAPEEQPTGHTGACALEDQGFEIRDAILLVQEAGRVHYVAKAAAKERHSGCEDMKAKRKEREKENQPSREELEELGMSEEDIAEILEKEDPIELNAHKGNAHPCLHPAALVMTAQGYRPISELREGSLVYAADGKFHPVEAVTRHPYTSENLYEIAVAGTNYTTPASDNHPFLIWRPQRTKKGNIKGGEVLWVQASEVNKGDYTLTPLLAKKPVQSTVVMPDRPDDTEFWFLFGLYLAEGVLQRAGHGSNIYPSYTLHEDETDLRDRIEAYTDAHTSTYPKKEGAAMQVIAFDPVLGDYFGFYGGSGASTKTLHPHLWNLPHDSRQALLEGYLAGDGGDVRTYKQAKTVSPDMASQIRLLAESMGYKANLFRYDAEPGKVGNRKFKSTLPTFQIRLYSDNQKLAEGGGRKPSRPTHLEHDGHSYMLRYVQSVTPVPYKGDVVNISVKGSPTFQTAVGMSHNTVKPKDVFVRLLSDVPAGETVLDPFMGSGSLGLACLETKHNYIGIEMEPDYLEIADRRLRYWNQITVGDGADIESEAPKEPEVREEVDLFDW